MTRRGDIVIADYSNVFGYVQAARIKCAEDADGDGIVARKNSGGLGRHFQQRLRRLASTVRVEVAVADEAGVEGQSGPLEGALITFETTIRALVLNRCIGDMGDAFVTERDKVSNSLFSRLLSVVKHGVFPRMARLAHQDEGFPLVHKLTELLVPCQGVEQDQTVDLLSAYETALSVGVTDRLNGLD